MRSSNDIQRVENLLKSSAPEIDDCIAQLWSQFEEDRKKIRYAEGPGSFDFWRGRRGERREYSNYSGLRARGCAIRDAINEAEAMKLEGPEIPDLHERLEALRRHVNTVDITSISYSAEAV